MVISSCPNPQMLKQLFSGRLDDEQAVPLEEHLLHCDRCVETVSGFVEDEDLAAASRVHKLLSNEHDDIIEQVIERAKKLRATADTVQVADTLAAGIPADSVDSRVTSSPANDEPEINFLAPPQHPGELGRLGDYRVLQVLGVGGMGIVFRAEDPRLKRQVALKAMKPGIASSRSAKERFIREAQFNASIEHDNIVHIYQVGEDRGVPFIAMQYLRGESLKTRLERDGKLSQSDVVRIGKEVAAGLAAAHKQGLIHRDIKPDNIWLEAETHRAKILDFGLVRAAAEDNGLTMTGMVVGTPQYMAPEQALGQPVDHRCDLFSLGSVLYQLVSGKQAFKGANLTATLMAVVQQDPASIENLAPNINPGLATLITKLLAKNRDDRPQTASEVSAALAEIEQALIPAATLTQTIAAPVIVSSKKVTPRKIPAKKVNASKPPARPPVRRWLLAAGAGGLALILGVIIITITNPDGSKTRIELPDTAKVEVNTVPNSSDSPPSTRNALLSSWHGWPADAPKPAIAPFDANQAKKHQEEWAAYLKLPVDYTNSIGMKFRLIPPGEFLMGSTAEEIEEALKFVGEHKDLEECIKSEAPQHKVILTQPIYLGVHEVTQAEYEKVMGVNPSYFAPTGEGKEDVDGLETGTHPVEMVGWNDTAEFCAKLSKQEELKPFYFRSGDTITPLDGTGYRLPTEAEWEYACRAGTTTMFWIGDKDEELMRAGWFVTNSGSRTHAVGELKANPYGLFDIHGNVWEWVEDWWETAYYGEFQGKPAIDPNGPSSAGSQRVVRGSNWHNLAPHCRAALRKAFHPPLLSYNIGFRVSLVADAVRQSLQVTGPAMPQPVATTPSTAVAASDPERTVAEWVLSIGGSVVVEHHGGGTGVSKPEDLPAGPLVVKDLRVPLDCKIPTSEWPSFRELKAIRALTVQDTLADDRWLEQISGLTSLEHLNLEGTKVTDAGMPQLKNLDRLENLRLGGNRVTVKGLASLVGLSRLRSLELPGTFGKVDDNAWPHFASFTRLSTLEIYARNMPNDVLRVMPAFPQLTTLNIHDSTSLDDTAMANLPAFPELREVLLSYNPRVTGAGLEKFLKNNRAALVYCNQDIQSSQIETLHQQFRGTTIIHPNGPIHADQKAAMEWLHSKSFTYNGRTPDGVPNVSFVIREIGCDHSPGEATEWQILQKLRSVRELDLYGDWVTDQHLEQIWKALDSEPRLGKFGIDGAGSPTTAAGLAGLAKQARLSILTLNQPQLGDEFSATLAKLTRLTQLNLIGKFSDAFFATIGECQELRTLTIQSEFITGEGLSGLRPLRELNKLTLTHNHFLQDEFLAPLADLPELTYLTLHGTPVSDDGLTHLAGCQQLRILRLTATHVTAEGVAKLQQALPKCTIFWDGNAPPAP